DGHREIVTARHVGDTPCSLSRHEIEVRRFTAYHRPETDEGVVPPRCRQALRAEWEFEGSRYDGHVDGVLRDAVAHQRLEGPRQQVIGHALVEAGEDDADPESLAVRAGLQMARHGRSARAYAGARRAGGRASPASCEGTRCYRPAARSRAAHGPRHR